MKCILLISALLPVAASAIEADAKRGAELFTRYHCTSCHSVAGGPGKTGGAPDLGQRLDRAYSPAGIASRMWNHAPKMWAAMKQADIDLPAMSEADASDLFAFFYSTRYFERRGDAARGKAVFFDKNCVLCHALNGPQKPAREWKSLSDPIDLVSAMWNHAGEMQTATKAEQFRWPQLSATQLTDLLVYLQNLPETRNMKFGFNLPNGGRGKALMEEKGCTGCHKGGMALETLMGNLTLTEVAAGMWNHAPKMREKAKPVTSEEMREILAYGWARQYFRSNGNAAKGGKLFDAQCAVCHNNPASGAPSLAAGKRDFSAITMVAALWRHGPRMLSKLESEHKAWPELKPADMANLIAYIGRQK